MINNPKTRLGANGVDEIKNHEFFKGIDWDELYKENIDPPYLPKLKSKTDLSLIPREMLERGISSNTLDDNDV